MFDLLRNPLKLLNDYDSPLYETFDMKRVTAVVIYVYSTKKIYTGTPNSNIRKLCTVHCGRNVNKPSALTEVEGKELKL